MISPCSGPSFFASSLSLCALTVVGAGGKCERNWKRKLHEIVRNRKNLKTVLPSHGVLDFLLTRQEQQNVALGLAHVNLRRMRNR